MAAGSTSKRSNAIDGRKAHNDNRYIKVGRVRMSSWMSKTLPIADIYISERELVHITTKHAKELNALGLDALAYIGYILNFSNEVRRGNTRGSFLFIVKPKGCTNQTVLQCAVLELTIGITNKKRIYKIKTAYPAIMGRLVKNELVCVKPRS